MLPASHHVQIAIPAGGEDAARAFHADQMGLVEVPKPEVFAGRSGVWFATGTIELHLGVDPAFSPASNAHIAVAITSLDDVRRQLTEARYPRQDDRPLPGTERFHTTDPFGNRTEFVIHLPRFQRASESPSPIGWSASWRDCASSMRTIGMDHLRIGPTGRKIIVPREVVQEWEFPAGRKKERRNAYGINECRSCCKVCFLQPICRN